MVQNYADVAGGRCGARTKQESFTKTSGKNRYDSVHSKRVRDVSTVGITCNNGDINIFVLCRS